MHTQLHARGASFIAAQTSDNPRDLVIEAIESLPDNDVKDQFDKFRSMLNNQSDAYQRAVDWYFFVNMRDYLVNPRTRTQDPMQRADALAQQRERIEAIKAKIVMLDLTMPNGKAMRECTGQEMATFGNRFQKIATAVGKSKKVGDVLSEEQVQKIMK